MTAHSLIARATLDALADPVGVVDRHGRVQSLNRAWRRFASEVNPLRELHEGDNFFEACGDAASHPALAELVRGTHEVLAGRCDSFVTECALHGPTRERWFEARAASLDALRGLCAITLVDTSARHEAERALQRKVLQHGLVARFGQVALENPPLAELAAQAAEVVQRGLNVELCRVLEATDDDHVLVQSAGCGWMPECLREPFFDATTETEDRFIIGTREAIVVADFSTEMRFRPSPILVRHGVRSGVEVLVCGAGGSYAVIGAYARDPGCFGEDSADFVRSVSNTLAAAIERKRAEERMAYMAQYDALTGLPNRTMYLDRVGQSLVEAERDRRPVGVLYVDIDRFKAVNDTLGHAAGDRLLEEIANRMAGTLRRGDTVGRLGGDEFAISLAHLACADDAAGVARKILAALATPFEVGGHALYVSASIGISIFPDDGREPDTLLKCADTAMYRAKESGRNTHHFYLPEMNERALARLRLESALRGALARREYLLHFQPKLGLRDGRLSGLEALLRWQPAGGALVAPSEFIPILEDTGLIIEVGEWIVASVCAQIARWQAEGLEPPPVAVNLSARQFRQQGFADTIERIVSASGIDPALLEFEITESVLMSDIESTVDALRQMKARGIRVSVDDFGTGYSSLAYLKRLPIDALKIDRSFIRDVTDNADGATITRAIINLAHSLSLKVVAEGVETMAQLDFLRTHACNEVQGFLFARPMPVANMTRALRDGLRLPSSEAVRPHPLRLPHTGHCVSSV